MYNIKGREVMWDMFLADKIENIKSELFAVMVYAVGFKWFIL